MITVQSSLLELDDLLLVDLENLKINLKII